MNVRFSCNGCGKCCHDHHVPLTLSESRQWIQEGGSLIILVEAFLENGLGLPDYQREHAQRRSLPVRCGQAQAYVAITFAAYNVGPCRNLQADNRCGIYARRPLVCRIYPAEINPHIPLRQEQKECAPESWLSGPELIHGGRVVDPELAALIERSRQADRDDIGGKAAICERLGISTSALKGDGFAAYLPDTTTLIEAMDAIEAETVLPEQDWALHVSSNDLASQLAATGAMIADALAQNGVFISLKAA